MKTYLLLSSIILVSACSRNTGTSHIIYDKATITQLSGKSVLKEQKSHQKAVLRKRNALAVYENKSLGKKSKKH
jgi:hypothetical protein